MVAWHPCVQHARSMAYKHLNESLSLLCALFILPITSCAEPSESQDIATASVDLPSAPCPQSDFALVQATIAELGGGCVSLGIDRVVYEDLLLDEETIAAGQVFRGRAITAYAWQRTFEMGQSVAAIISLASPEIVDGSLARPGPASLTLFPFVEERVQIQWGRAMLSAALDELTAPNCGEVLEQRRVESTDLVPETDSGSTTTTTTAPAQDSTCD